MCISKRPAFTFTCARRAFILHARAIAHTLAQRPIPPASLGLCLPAAHAAHAGAHGAHGSTKAGCAPLKRLAPARAMQATGKEAQFMRLVDPILKAYQEQQHLLVDKGMSLCPADQRVQVLSAFVRVWKPWRVGRCLRERACVRTCPPQRVCVASNSGVVRDRCGVANCSRGLNTNSSRDGLPAPLTDLAPCSIPEP
jgi:hypothetical protein